uniref:F-box only protein 28 n=3 Tax=Lygus hesperus TaxID=30085 RepID=A0A0A9VW47_LYGHE
MDKISGSVLNSTFQKLQTQMLHRFQTIKAKMPRRESARRNHPLACESDIIETLHMRLTLLQMSFGKHIERKHCCFFPGEILDEVYRILHYVRITPKLARPYRVTDELYDLSTMAMEYFKEHIEPRLPEIAYFGTDFFEFPGSLQNSSSNNKWMLESPPHSGIKSEYESSGPMECGRSSDPPSQPAQTNIFLRKRIRKIKQGMKKYNSQLALMKKELKSYKNKMSEQQKQFHEHMARMDDYEKKNEETSRKFSTLLQELNKCKTELQYWRSKSPLSSLCAACGKRNEMSPEEILLMAQCGPATSCVLPDDPQPSTSWMTPCVPSTSPPPPPPPVQETEDLKARQAVVTKRKSVSETPASHSKRSKKPRAMLKVRHKRS